MIIKQADDKSKDIQTLQELAARTDATPDVRQRIEQEIRNIRSGMKGEAEAAFEMEFNYAASKNWMVIHDLRLECDGRVAQIDHLLINRFLKSTSAKVSVLVKASPSTSMASSQPLRQ